MAKLKISRRNLVAGAAGSTVLSLAHAVPAAAGAPVAGFPAPISEIPFGSFSHWLQPWRELCQTRSLEEIEAGIGVNIGGYPAQDALDMLHAQGFRHARIEIGWGLVDAQNETKFRNQAVLTAFLGRLQTAGLRPLILLNANDGDPCPAVTFNVQAVTGAPAGARSITLSSTAGLVPGRSGFSHLVGSTMASVLVTEIAGQQVTLSKPLPAAIAAGTAIAFVTLNYEPFSAPGSPRNDRTMQGWLRYVDLVCQTATAALGTANQPDRGFDFEIWNELTFGSRFLAINNYYDPMLVDYQSTQIWAYIVQQTAEHVSAAGTAYQGVRLSDGFSNTIPWSAASMEPPRVSAMGKHPYPRDLSFPKDEPLHHPELDALGQKTDFVPTYKTYFPEYFAHVIQSESLCRDLSDEPNMIGPTAHGRLARIVGGNASPVDLWLTEIGCAPATYGFTEPLQAQRFMAVFLLRSVFFHLGIGAGRIYLFQAFGIPGSFGLADQATPTLPSPALIALARVLSAIKGDPNNQLRQAPTPVTATAFRGPADGVLFAGDGTPNLPPMTTADSLVMLPVQSAANHIAIIYYIATRDIRVPLGPQRITVSIQAKNIQNFAASSYDPLTDQYAGIAKKAGAQDQVELQLSATDTPQVLLFTLAS